MERIKEGDIVTACDPGNQDSLKESVVWEPG